MPLVKIFLLIMVLLFLPDTILADDHSARRAYEPITGIDLGVEDLTLETGETYNFKIRYEPEEPYYYTLKWFVSNDSVISVDMAKKEVTALAPGSARILAESLDGMAYTTCNVTVNGVAGKDAPEMKSGSALITIPDKDRAKITAKSVVRNLEFIENTYFSASSYNSAANRIFFVTAEVKPGTEKAESRRAKALGMEKVQTLTNLHMVNLTGTLEQILSFTADNPDLTEIFELDDSFLIDPVENDQEDGTIEKTMNLSGCTEELTSVSTAHNLGLKGGGVTIAVIDSGLDSTHEQFKGRVISEKCFSKSGKTDETTRYESACANGKEEGPSAKPAPDVIKPGYYDHGSHVAGIAAGRDGIAPEAKIAAVQAFSDYIWWCTEEDAKNGYYWKTENGKDWCYDNRIQFQSKLSAYDWLLTVQETLKENGDPEIAVVNMSYGGGKRNVVCDTYQPKEFEAFEKLLDAGIIPVASSGNSKHDGYIGSPACKSNVIAVGALNDSAVPQIAFFSNHSDLIDMMAPGKKIYSALQTPNKYGYKNGTSMAAPMVSGALAIMKQAFPDLTPDELSDKLIAMSGKTVNERTNGTVFEYTKPVLDFSKFKTPASVVIKNSDGTDITGQEICIHSKDYQLKAKVSPANAPQRIKWSSGDKDTAAVTQSGKVSFKKYGSVDITAAAVFGSPKKSGTVKFVYAPYATGITIKDSDGKAVNGKDLSSIKNPGQFSVSAAPSEAVQKFKWTSSDTSVATVKNGLLTFNKTGKVKVTVTAADGSGVSDYSYFTLKPAVSSITIKNAPGYSVNGRSISTAKSAYQFSASASPADAMQKFSWSVSDTSIAAVDSTGKVTFNKPGSVDITVKAKDGSGKTAGFNLTYCLKTTSVSIKNKAGNDVTGRSLSTIKNTYQLSASASPAKAMQKFKWTSSDTSVATVDSTGNVTFRKPGTVKITAKAKDGSGISAYINFTYYRKTTSITIKNQPGYNVNGRSVSTRKNPYRFTASASPAKAMQTFKWTSDNTNIATVDSTGMVTFKKAGTVTITAKAKDGSGVSASFKVTYKQ